MSVQPDSTSTGVPLTLDGHRILFPPLPYHLSPAAAAATVDADLQSALNRATVMRDGARKSHCREVFGDRYDAMRSLAGSIKQHTLDHLDFYVEQFVERAEAAGTHVHFARNGEDASHICLDIARGNGCRLCVKSKSMVTEEIGLLHALESIGVETVETDLGEFIVQLDHDAPSHIVTPIIHKDRKAVGRAFTRELGVPYTEDPPQLTMIARSHLRDKYRHADLGLSGANFLVAATGSVVLCTNEGNGRMCTSVPRIHVACVGIEKLVPELRHLSVFLKLLSRSAVGTPITVYNHLITGPRRAHEPDGPEQVHVVLVDNGRTQILRPPTRSMLRCIRCGACLNACPVYRKIGGHAYGAVYSGPIGALITPMFRGLANYKDLPQASSLCGACYEACPVKIDIPRQLIRLRQELVGRQLTSPLDRAVYRMWSLALSHPVTYRLSQRAQRVLLRLGARLKGALPGGNAYHARGWLVDAPGPLRAWTSQRDMPTPTARGFRDWWRRREGAGDDG